MIDINQKRGRLSALAVGHITHDRYGQTLAPGGSVLYAAKTLQALGVEAAIATSLGDDFVFQDQLEGITLSVIQCSATTVFENTYPKDAPRLMLVEHTAEPVTPTNLPIELSDIDILFLAPVIGEVSLIEWLSALQKKAIKARIVGIGLQGFLKQPGRLYEPDRPGRMLAPTEFKLPDSLPLGVTAAFMSKEDLDGFADKDLLGNLRRMISIVAVTDGEQGATVYYKEKVIEVGIRPTKAVDPTGAGDTFAAAFLFSLASGDSVEQAAKTASAAASIAVEAKGPAALSRAREALVCRDAVRVRSLG